MAAVGRLSRAPQACTTCKTRKKKCDKVSPSCGYCTQKDLQCSYLLPPRSHRHNIHVNHGTTPPASTWRTSMQMGTPYGLTPSDTTPSEPASIQASFYRSSLGDLDGVYAEVHSLIRSTGQFIDDITARYFQDFHRHLPVVSRSRFQSSLIASGKAPCADLSVLLLCMFLVTYSPNHKQHPVGGTTRAVSRQSLYLAAKSLFAQVQASSTPSVHIIQANLILATFEYASGRAEEAFITVAGCARIAYAAGIHRRNLRGPFVSTAICHGSSSESHLASEEAANTWWGIVNLERAILCELSDFEQPLITPSPTGDARLPIEGNILDQEDHLDAEPIPNILVSCLNSEKLGSFSRAAQATCLLDQVLKGLKTPDLDCRLLQLQGLDTAIQAYLALVLPACQVEIGVFCAAIAISIRALFMLHCHIIKLPAQPVSASFKSLEEWKESSQAALDTSTRMVIDIAECHGDLPADFLNYTPPSHIYIVRAAIRHMHSRSDPSDIPWPRACEGRLHSYLNLFERRWSITDN